MSGFTEFPSLAALVDVMCLWHDTEHGPFPDTVYCGSDPSKPCVVGFDPSSGESKAARAKKLDTLGTLGGQCGFEIHRTGKVDPGLAACRLEELPCWKPAFRDPLTASPGGGRLHVPERRYILGARSVENSNAIWNGLRSYRAPGLAVRPVPETEFQGGGHYLHFWEITAGLPAPATASDRERPVISPPPLSILNLADRTWWELPDPRSRTSSSLFFEWPFEPVLGDDAHKVLRALLAENDVILLSRSAPLHLRLERFRDERAFRELVHIFPLAKADTGGQVPRLAADEGVDFETAPGTFPIELHLAPAEGRRALDNRDRELELRINALTLQRSRRRALDIRMGRLGQRTIWPLIVEDRDVRQMPEEIREGFRQWAEGGQKAIRQVFTRPLLVYLAPSGPEPPDPVRDLLLDFAGRDEDLHALRYLWLPPEEVPFWQRVGEVPLAAHFVTTCLALGEPLETLAEADRLQILGLRLLDYRPRRGANVEFELSPEWADAYDLRLFIPSGARLDFYPPIVPSELAARNLANALLPPGGNGSGPAGEWCALVLPGVRSDAPARCVQLRRGAFRPLSESFNWDIRCTASLLHPEVPTQLPSAADAVAEALKTTFDTRAKARIEEIRAERIKSVDAVRVEFDTLSKRARGLRDEAVEGKVEIARVEKMLVDLNTQRTRMRRAVTQLRGKMVQWKKTSAGTRDLVKGLDEVLQELAAIEAQITAL